MVTTVAILSAVAGGLVTWLLNQLSGIITNRLERRKPLGRALADLLELRHQSFALRRAIRFLFSSSRLPPQLSGQQELIRKLVERETMQLRALLADGAKLAERYNSAVDLVAEVDPMLAFQLRAKDKLPQLLEFLSGLAPGEVLAMHGLPNLPEEIRAILEDDFDEFIMYLARLHGWQTSREVRRHLARGVVLPPELDELFSRYSGSLDRALCRDPAAQFRLAQISNSARVLDGTESSLAPEAPGATVAGLIP